MSTTARERGRAYLRMPADGRTLAVGVAYGIVGGLVIAGLAAVLGVEGSFPAQLAIAVVLGLVIGLVLRAVQARRGPPAAGD